MKKHLTTSRILRGVIGTAGFILSPLSWWNDLVVNFPLSYGFAWLVGRPLSIFIRIDQWFFINLFIAGYFLTNLLGFLMIHYSLFGWKKEGTYSLGKQALFALGYTLIIVLFFGLDICNPETGCPFFPSWVESST
jgi:hypothetical protein